MHRRLHLDDAHIVLPKGTRVVLTRDAPARDGWICRKGTAGRVATVAHPAYVLETPAGHVIDVERTALTIQDTKQKEYATHRTWAWQTLAPHVVLEVVVGSTAWNLAGPDSDEDVKGIFLLPFDHGSGIYEAPSEIQDPTRDAQFWEVDKAIRQGLRAEANTLEALWTPLVVRADPIGQLLRDRREIFVSKRIFSSFGRYAISQFDKIKKRLEQRETEEALIAAIRARPELGLDAIAASLSADGLGTPRQAVERLKRLAHSLFDSGRLPSRDYLELRGWVLSGGDEEHRPPYRPKNAYNLLRLLHSGIQWLEQGEPLIRVEADRPDDLQRRLMAVKHQEVPIEDVVEEARELAARFEVVHAESTLPEEPDVEAADALLRACRSHAARQHFQIATPLPRGHAAVDRSPPRFEVPIEQIRQWLARFDHLDPVICAVTGAHIFGFPSPDSDIDLKSIHVAPASAALGLAGPGPSVDVTEIVDGLELDYTSNEAGEAVKLLLAGNGNMLERLLSPYQVLPAPGTDPRREARLEELRELAVASVSRASHTHYAGYLRGMEKEYAKRPRVKALLYRYRVALTGIHLLTTGEVVADLGLLAPRYGYDRATTLIAIKTAGQEKQDASELPPELLEAVLADLEALGRALWEAREGSPLPERPPNQADLEAWLVCWRTGGR